MTELGSTTFFRVIVFTSNFVTKTRKTLPHLFLPEACLALLLLGINNYTAVLVHCCGTTPSMHTEVLVTFGTRLRTQDKLYNIVYTQYTHGVSAAGDYINAANSFWTETTNVSVFASQGRYEENTWAVLWTVGRTVF